MYLLLFGLFIMIFGMAWLKIDEYIIMASVIGYVILIIIKWRNDTALQRLAMETGKKINENQEIITKKTRNYDKLKENAVSITIMISHLVMLILISKFATKEHALMYLLTMWIIFPITKKALDYLVDVKGLLAIDFKNKKLYALELSFRAMRKLQFLDDAGITSYLHEPFKGKKGEWFIVNELQLSEAKVLINECHNNDALLRGQRKAFIKLRKDWAQIREEISTMMAMQDRLIMVGAVRLLNRISVMKKSLSEIISGDENVKESDLSPEELTVLHKYYPEKLKENKIDNKEDSE